MLMAEHRTASVLAVRAVTQFAFLKIHPDCEMSAFHLVAFSLLEGMILRETVGFPELGYGVGIDTVTHFFSFCGLVHRSL